MKNGGSFQFAMLIYEAGYTIPVYTPKMHSFNSEHDDTSTVLVQGPWGRGPQKLPDIGNVFLDTEMLCGPLPFPGFPGPLGRKLSYIEHQRLPWHPEGSGMEVVDSCWFCKRLPQLNMWLCPEIDYTWHSEMAMFGSTMRGTPWQNPVEHVLHSKFKWKSSIVPSNQWARPSCSATHGYKWSTGYVDRRFIWVYDIWVNKLIR